MKKLNDLIKKYDVPVPRYTSYPTVPCWDEKNFNVPSWRHAVKQVFDESNDNLGISVYIHLPFCESLCTYCACNTRITKNHAVEKKYLEAILTEWKLYQNIFGRQPLIREIHLGGGTPTFFNPDNLKYLIKNILAKSDIHPHYEFSFEGHPNNTTKEHLQSLYDLGFKRVSYGIQDLDPIVQKAIHRIQPIENVQRAVENARNIGYESISFDLIYGLPYQTIDTITKTIRKTLELHPDRIAFYSYAHVPWLRPGQRGYEDANLPSDVEKRNLYEVGKKLLVEEGYFEIGMDHFSLPHDSLFMAKSNNTLHRNFMGYTTSETDLLVGLGTSAISDAKYAYAQNVKNVESYEAAIATHQLAVSKGHLQSKEDLLLKECIRQIACTGKLNQLQLINVMYEDIRHELNTMQSEGILQLTNGDLTLTTMGKAFIRNVCKVFDMRLRKSNPDSSIYSKAI